jgi:polyphosphate kinase
VSLPPDALINRELSWLDFNARVLELAAESTVPLLERVKFCAIFSANLDEFFQVRVAALKDQVAAALTRLSPDGRTPGQQLIEISDRIDDLVRAQDDLYIHELVPSLTRSGIEIVDWSELTVEERKQLSEIFETRVFPVLTPLAVDPAHPFPYISNLSLNLAVMVRDPELGDRRFARVKVPPSLPRFIPVGDGWRFIPLEQVIAGHLDVLFPGMEIEDQFAFRVTRNADLTLEEEEADDLLAAVEMELRRRRFGRAVRLEIAEGMSAEILELLVRELDLTADDVSTHRSPLDLRTLFGIHAVDRPDLKDQPWPPLTKPRLTEASDTGRSIFSVIRAGNVLVHHPYDSFATSVEDFLDQAASDPRVLAVKVTLYRPSVESPVARSLIRAAERGVQVVALVELKARFDEQANIQWAKDLERAGVHVVYGLVGLKTHAKCALVIRSDDDGIRRYCHIGTGNYNSSTARVYEDFGVFTADPDIGDDLTQLFNHLTGYSREVRYRRILVAPKGMRRQFLELIQNEARYGPAGRIVLKMNSLVDTDMIEALYQASRAGVPIDLVVRGICCLRPGVSGLSETIRVRSILGRYLEHSRVFLFGNGAAPGRPTVLVGSADLMPRNLDRRVEVLTPLVSEEHRQRVIEVLDVNLDDDVARWELDSDGSWERLTGPQRVEAQERLYQLARARARRGA